MPVMEYQSPLGSMVLRSYKCALVELRFGNTVSSESDAVLRAATGWLDAYFAGGSPVDMPALEPAGTAFELAVWRQCLRIPYGERCSYGTVARMLGNLGAARAVGRALACNPLLIIIPCHRVVPASGGIGRYVAGEEKKRWLLEWEMIDKSALWV